MQGKPAIYGELGQATRSKGIRVMTQGSNTAFVIFATRMRNLSKGTINQKKIYSLLGIDGEIYNHANPLARKSNAGELSRIVRSSRYVDSLKNRFNQNNLTFTNAALRIADEMCGGDECIARATTSDLLSDTWTCVYAGFVEESLTFRRDIDLKRLLVEANALCTYTNRLLASDTAPTDALALVLESYFHFLAFGHLDKMKARSMVDDAPCDSADEFLNGFPRPQRPCFIKIDSRDGSILDTLFVIDTDAPIVFGCYTDCDIINTLPRVSGVHACVYKRKDIWWFEDLGSDYGSSVFRGSCCPEYDSAIDGARIPFALQYGDQIELADDTARYRFAKCRIPDYRAWRALT